MAMSEAQKKWRKDNAAHLKEYQRKWREAKKKDPEYVAKQREKGREGDRKRATCPKRIAYKEEYYTRTRHVQVGKKHQKELAKRHPEEFARSSITDDLMIFWVERMQGTACPHCGDEASHIDHKTPLALGGKHELWNLEYICKTCNIGKGAMTREDYVAWQDRMIQHRATT